MAHLHRNSQKRIFEEGAEYFITSVTGERHPYFKNPILAELFIRDLLFAKELKQFDLFGYTVMPNHVHLLIQPKGKANYSEIMRSIKANFSRDANDIILNRVDRFQIPLGGDVAPRRLLDQPKSKSISSYRLQGTLNQNAATATPRRLQMFQQYYLNVVKPLHQRFLAKHGKKHDIPRFVWQKSFRDHLIRDEDDYLNHLEYVYNNAVKHGLVKDPDKYPWMWVTGMRRPFEPD